MSVVEPDEWEDFKSLLDAQGFSESDFELKETRDQPDAVELSPVTGTLTIISKRNSFSKTYRVGHMSGWLVDLETDLFAGAFGPPQR